LTYIGLIAVRKGKFRDRIVLHGAGELPGVNVLHNDGPRVKLSTWDPFRIVPALTYHLDKREELTGTK